MRYACRESHIHELAVLMVHGNRGLSVAGLQEMRTILEVVSAKEMDPKYDRTMYMWVLYQGIVPKYGLRVPSVWRELVKATSSKNSE